MEFRKRVNQVLEVANPGDRVSRLVDICILSLILLNVAALVLGSVPEFEARFRGFFSGFERVSLVVFTIEYILRMWACVESPDYASPIRGRIRFAFTAPALIDLLAVLPFFIGWDARFLRILRLLKLSRYIPAMSMFQRVIIKKRAELMVTLFIICILLIFTACLIYVVEHEDNPEQFGTIPKAMWWSIVTLTTVGYGDASPTSGLGQLLAGFVAVLGIGMFALPTSILGAAFLEEMGRNKKSNPTRCPHCGEEI